MKPYSEQERFKKNMPTPVPDAELDYYFTNAYHDMRFFLKTITKNNANSYTYFGDMQKQLFYISDNLKETFGFESNLVKDLLQAWRGRIHGDKWRELYDQSLKGILKEKRSVHDLRYQVADKNGKVFWIRCCGEIQWNDDKTQPLFFAGRITRQDDAFLVDTVTNFPSQTALTRYLADLQQAGEHCLAIGFCLNNISQVNTMKGRKMGDRLIREISSRLMDTLSLKMAFYRLPGVRCVALVDPSVTEDRESLMSQIRRIIDEGYAHLGIVVNRPSSFALMDFPQPGLTPEAFQENLVSLIKMARHDPRQPYIENSEENLQKLQHFSSMEMALCADVRSGMRNFRPVIQPVVSVETGKIIAGETLMRWQYEGKDVSPGLFIPILEKDSMIHTAGRWIFEEAVQACKQILTYIPDFYLTVNLSLQQLYDTGFLAFIPEMLQKYQLDGRHLVIEMTESCMDEEPQLLLDLVDVCEQLGIRIALDDFGTGYSSLRVLLQYPSSIIKLDRSLLLEMTESEEKKNFVSSIVFACHRFGKTVCLEGVENELQNGLAKEASCDMIQGFFYHRPSNLQDVYKTIQQQAAG